MPFKSLERKMLNILAIKCNIYCDNCTMTHRQINLVSTAFFHAFLLMFLKVKTNGLPVGMLVSGSGIFIECSRYVMAGHTSRLHFILRV